MSACAPQIVLLVELLIVITAGSLPTANLVTDQVDLIEVNRVYNVEGREVLAQVIFWDWRPESGSYRVVAWRMLRSPHQVPRRDWLRGGYVALWHDGETLREVRAPVRHFSWTHHDPEIADRSIVPREARRRLSKPKW